LYWPTTQRNPLLQKHRPTLVRYEQQNSQNFPREPEEKKAPSRTREAKVRAHKSSRVKTARRSYGSALSLIVLLALAVPICVLCTCGIPSVSTNTTREEKRQKK